MGSSSQEEYVPVYGTPDLEVYCLGGDRLFLSGLGSGQSVGESLVKRGLGGIVDRIRNRIRMNRLFKDAERDGASLDEFFLFTPHLWTALLFMVTTRGAGEIDRGAIALTHVEWMNLLNHYLASCDEKELPRAEREEIVGKADECFREGAEVFYDDPSDEDVLTFLMRW